MSELGPDEQARLDSLAAAASAVGGSRRLQKLLPYVLAALTAVLGWASAKIDTRLDIQAEVRQQMQALTEQQAERHAQLIGKLDGLDRRLLNPDVNQPGKVVQVEKGVWLAYRALSEVRAMTLAGESAKAREAKERQGERFTRAFDNRALGRDPQLAYAELVEQVRVP